MKAGDFFYAKGVMVFTNNVTVSEGVIDVVASGGNFTVSGTGASWDSGVSGGVYMFSVATFGSTDGVTVAPSGWDEVVTAPLSHDSFDYCYQVFISASNDSLSVSGFGSPSGSESLGVVTHYGDATTVGAYSIGEIRDNYGPGYNPFSNFRPEYVPDFRHRRVEHSGITYELTATGGWFREPFSLATYSPHDVVREQDFGGSFYRAFIVFHPFGTLGAGIDHSATGEISTVEGDYVRKKAGHFFTVVLPYADS